MEKNWYPMTVFKDNQPTSAAHSANWCIFNWIILVWVLLLIFQIRKKDIWKGSKILMVNTICHNFWQFKTNFYEKGTFEDTSWYLNLVSDQTKTLEKAPLCLNYIKKLSICPVQCYITFFTICVKVSPWNFNHSEKFLTSMNLYQHQIKWMLKTQKKIT